MSEFGTQKPLTEEDMEAILLLAVQESSDASSSDIRARLHDVADELGITPEQLSAAESKYMANQESLPLFRLDVKEEYSLFRRSQLVGASIWAAATTLFCIVATINASALKPEEPGFVGEIWLAGVIVIGYVFGTIANGRSAKNLERFEKYLDGLRNSKLFKRGEDNG